MAKSYKEYFDIDLKVIYQKFLDQTSTSTSNINRRNYDGSFLRFKNELHNYLKDVGIEFKTFESIPMLVVPSNHNLYDLFLMHDLYFRKVYSIRSYLDYHYKNFRGNHYAKNQEDFIGLLKFTVSGRFDSAYPYKSKSHTYEILQWIREKEGNAQSDPRLILIQKVSLNGRDLTKSIKILVTYFSNEDLTKLSYLLSGNIVPGKLCFIGKANKLVDFTRRLKQTKKIQAHYKDLAEWFYIFFEYEDSKEKRKKFARTSTLNVLKKKRYHCKNPIPAVRDWLGA
jgi:hypothetical protein